jgi:Fe-S-cluster containining protein
VSDPRCRSCGACCTVPTPEPKDWPPWWTRDAPTQDLSDGTRVTVVGTRCEALVGTVGERVACGVYQIRPQCCRTFTPGDAECQAARKLVNLPQLC